MKYLSVVVVMGGSICDPSLGRRVSIWAAYRALEVQSTISRERASDSFSLGLGEPIVHNATLHSRYFCREHRYMVHVPS